MKSESQPLISNDVTCQSLIFMLHSYPFEYGPCHLLFYYNMSTLVPWAQPSGYLEQIHPFRVVSTVGYIPGMLLCEHPHIPSPTNATAVPIFTVISLRLAPPKCSVVVPFPFLDHPSNLFSWTNLLGIFQMIISSSWIHFKGAIITHFEMVCADFSSQLDKGSDNLHTFYYPVYHTISRYTIRLSFNVVSLRRSSTFGKSW